MTPHWGCNITEGFFTLKQSPKWQYNKNAGALDEKKIILEITSLVAGEPRAKKNIETAPTKSENFEKMSRQ